MITDLTPYRRYLDNFSSSKAQFVGHRYAIDVVYMKLWFRRGIAVDNETPWNRKKVEADPIITLVVALGARYGWVCSKSGCVQALKRNERRALASLSLLTIHHLL